ncbi:hypothetical protein ABH922_005352 [Rhodococcus sp. 27YEA15]
MPVPHGSRAALHGGDTASAFVGIERRPRRRNLIDLHERQEGSRDLTFVSSRGDIVCGYGKGCHMSVGTDRAWVTRMCRHPSDEGSARQAGDTEAGPVSGLHGDVGVGHVF